MNKKQLTILSTLILFILSACGGAAEPTITAADVEGTAVANAWIALTQTQAALPTQTPSPIPSETPTIQPTMTAAALVLPTLAPPTLAVVTTPTNPADDPCNQPPPAEPKGLTVKVKFVNKSGGQAALSFGMNFPNKIGECGTYGYTLGPFDEPTVTVLAGCYWGYAWITGDKPSVAKTGDAILCVDDPNEVRAIWITSENIGFH